MEQLRCVVERITFQNEQNGYSVIKCMAKGFTDLVTVVGAMPDVHVGSVLTLTGSWHVDARYGRQFAMETYDFPGLLVAGRIVDHDAVLHLVIEEAIIHVAGLAATRAGEGKGRAIPNGLLHLGVHHGIDALPDDEIGCLAAARAGNGNGAFHRQSMCLLSWMF